MSETKAKKPIFKKWWFWVIVVVVVLAIGGAVGGGSSNGSDSASSAATSQKTQGGDSSKTDGGASSEQKTEKTIELQATATGNGTVIWTKSGSSNTEQFSGSWSKTFTGDETKDLTGVSVTGDVMGGNDQKVTCKVIVNGEEKDSKEATGAAGSAFCTVPLF
ncbi:hypothetical protein [Bifidobacterium parmae]|uniref:Transcriptional regulator n=1 Tax=Bifidobacterium parmae TaxID=361854 RepID=A0A2N5J364_9BIFI|nr:hypothetical protein [Bifidobacterium parmae]PLS28636.1 transcriptional regulator [Bifidobacterium parmae]